MLIFSKTYSLRKSRQIFKTSFKWYQKKGAQLASPQRLLLESDLQELDQAIVDGNREKANDLAHKLEEFNAVHIKKGFWDYLLEIAFALVFALILATVIRQVWFELYEIPSGSMRPTFEEQDRLTVSKTTFGINIPLKTEHLYFEPNLVQRGGVVIWSGDGVPHLDSNSTFLGIFPYTKRYIKRCMGKDGDTLYFYGGKIYAFDKEGRDLEELRNSPWLEKLDHIPFIHFEGRVSYIQESKQSMVSKVVFNLINQPIGRMTFSRGSARGEIFNGKEWIKDKPEAQRTPHTTVQTYSDYFGMRNYAMARMLTKEQIKTWTHYNLEEIGDAEAYLELRHTPSLSYPQPIIERYGVFLSGFTTLLPLKAEHIKTLMDNMYTARFAIKDGRADRYRQEGEARFSASSPLFAKTPNGTYEFYFGKAYHIGWGGIPTLLDAQNPLYSTVPLHVQKLFNVGIDISNDVAPRQENQALFPNRYAYFRDGDLYVLGAPLMQKGDPVLNQFNALEEKKEKSSSNNSPYVAFKDYGPPLTKEGKLDKEFIRTFGYTIPAKHYLMLGDNHAMSQDSRHFGPIPQTNLQGTPSLILWPPSSRWGFPNQKPYPIFTLPRMMVWSTIATIALIWYLIHRWRLRKPAFKKIDAKS